MALNKNKQNKYKTDNEINESEEENSSKFIKNQVLERHMKENSFKLNNSLFKGDITDKHFKLSQIVKLSPILLLKVINSASNIQKNLEIEINAQGILEYKCRNAKDGYSFFGFYPEGHKVS